MLSTSRMHPVLPAASLQRARAWYAEKLRLEPVMDLEGGLIYQTAGGMFLVYETPSASTARNTAAGWVVDDLDATMAELRGRGVAFEDYDIVDGPTTVDGVATSTSGRAAWFKDSEGNILSLTELPPGFALA